MAKLSLLILTLLLLNGCTKSTEPVNRCDQLRAKLQSEWTTTNAVNYTENCASTNHVGSKSWCRDVKSVIQNDGWTETKAEVVGYKEYCEF